ncbi:hypothetical protein, partial [Desulforamulus profundi]|uniref:hypothetical protein n=1 Tax=Desulforamulus profundi TaxID=1383067 RepID=UPI001A9A6DAF
FCACNHIGHSQFIFRSSITSAFAFGPLFCRSTLKAFSYLKTSKNWLQGCWLGFTLVGLTPTRLSDLTRPHYTKLITSSMSIFFILTTVLFAGQLPGSPVVTVTVAAASAATPEHHRYH